MNHRSQTSAVDIDHVRHDLSAVLAIAKTILADMKSDPATAEILAKSTVQKLAALLEYIDKYSGPGDLV